MATEADIAAPICETIREEEGKNDLGQAANISINKEKKIQVDTPKEPPTIEGESFLRNPSNVDVHCEVNSILTDVNKVTEKPLEKEVFASEDNLIKQDAEREEAQLSKDTACGTNNSDASFTITSDVHKEKLDASADATICQEDIASIVENVLIISNEKIEENSTTKVDAQVREVESCEAEKSTETTSLKKEAEPEKPKESLHVASEEDMVLDEKTLDAAEIKEETIEDVATVDSNGKTEESYSKMTQEVNLEKEIENTSSLHDESTITEEAKIDDECRTIVEASNTEKNIEPSFTANTQETIDATEKESVATKVNQVDGSEMKHEAHLKKETSNDESKPEYRDENVIINAELLGNDQCTSNLVKEEAQEEKPIDSLQIAVNDVNECDTSQDTKTSFGEEQFLTKDSQQVLGDKIEEKTYDSAETKEETHEIYTESYETPKEPPTIEGNSFSINLSIVDDHCEVNSTLLDANKVNEMPLEKKVSASEESLIQQDAEREEAQLSKVTTCDERGINSSEVENLNVSITSDVHKGKCANDQNTTSEQEGLEDKIITAENLDASADAAICQEDITSLETITKTEVVEDVSIISKEKTGENSTTKIDAEVRDVESCEAEKSTETTSLKKEAEPEKPKESLHVASEEYIKVSDLVLDEKTLDAAEIKEETFEDVATVDSSEKTEESSLISVDCSKMKQEANLGKEIENRSLVNDESTITQEAKIDDECQTIVEAPNTEKNIETASLEEPSFTANTQETIDATEKEGTLEVQDENLIINAELLGNEQCTSNLVKEEARVEKPIDSLQISANDDGCDASQDTKTSFGEEQFLTTDAQQVSGDKIVEKTYDSAETKEETLENIATDLPIRGKEDNSQVPSLEEASTVHEEESATTCEAKFVEERSTNAEANLIKEEESIEALLVPAEDIKSFDSVQDIETSLEEQNGTTGDHIKDETHDVSSLEKEAPEDKNLATTTTYDDAKEKLLDQDDCSQMDQNEHLETKSKNESSSLVGEERVEKSIDSLQIATEDIKECASEQDIESSSIVELKTEKKLGENTEGNTIDSPDRNENVATTILDEDCLEKEHLEKESENLTVTEAQTKETTEDESVSIHEPKNMDDDVIKAELLETEKHASIIVKEEAPLEEPIESSQEDTMDINESDSCQDANMRSIEEKIDSADHQGISNVDATRGKEGTLEDNATSVASESLIEEDGSRKDSTDNSNDDESTVKYETNFVDESSTKDDPFKNEKNTEDMSEKEQAPIEDMEVFDSVQDKETSSLEEQSLIVNCEGTVGDHKEDKGNDAATSMEEEIPHEDTQQKIATIVPHEDTEEKKSLTQVDCSDKECEEHLAEESEAATDETNNESTSTHDAVTFELPNEKHASSTVVKDEPASEKHPESSPVDTEDVDDADSSRDKRSSCIEEQILTTDPRDISSDKIEGKTIETNETKEETLEDIATNVPSEEYNDNSLVEENCSQKPSLEEASTCNANEDELAIKHEAEYVGESSTKTSYLEEQGISANRQSIIGECEEDKINDEIGVKEETPKDKVKHGEHLEEESEISSLTEAPAQKNDDGESKDIHEPGKVESWGNEDCIINTVVKEEAHVEHPIDSLQATEEIKEFDSNQDTIDSKEETFEETASNVPNGENEDNSQRASMKETTTCDTNEDESIITQEAKVADESSIKADLSENEKNIGDTLVKEEVSEDTKACNPIGEAETSSLKEQSPPADCQGTSGDNKESKIDEDDKEEKSLERDDCMQMEHHENQSETSSSTEAPTRETETESSLIITEAQPEKPIDSSQVTGEDIKAAASCQGTEASSIEDKSLTPIEHTLERTLVKEEAQAEKLVDSFEEADEDIKAPTSATDLETSSIEEHIQTTDQQEISDDNIEEKTTDAICKEETLENVDTKEKSIVQVDCSQAEHEQHLEKEREKASSVEAPTTKHEITENTIPSSLSQDKEISCIEETVLTEDPQDIPGGITDEQTINATETEKVPNEIENVDIKDDKEEGYCNDLQTTSAVNIAVQEEQDSDSSAIKIPNVNNDMVVVEEDAEDPNCKQDELEEHINVAGVTSLASEPSELHREVELIQHDPDARSDQKEIEALSVSASFSDSESNDEQVKRSSDHYKEISDSSNSVASEEVSTSTTLEESRGEIEQHTVNEEAEKQEDLPVSELIKELLMENIDKDVKLESSHKSEITQEIEVKSSPSPDEKMVEGIMEKTDSKQTEALEDATEDKYIEHPEQDDAMKRILQDSESTQIEQEETECRREEVVLDEIVEGIEDSTSIPVAEDFLTKSSEEPAETEKEIKVADTTESTETNDSTSLGDNLTNSKSTVETETKVDNEAAKTIDTTLTATEGQEIESTSLSITSMFEKSDSSENKSGCQPKHQVLLEPIPQVQSSDIIPKTYDENLEETTKIKSEPDDWFDISSTKVKEDSCNKEVITKIQHEPEAGSEVLPISASFDGSESNGEQAKRSSDQCKEILEISESVALKKVSSSSVASEEVSTFANFEESRGEIQQEAEKQEEDLPVSELIKNSLVDIIDNDAKLASCSESEIIEVVEEKKLPSSDEKIEKTDCKGSEAVEDVIEDKYIEQPQQDDATRSILHDTETECRREEVALDKMVEEIKDSTLVPVAEEFITKSSEEPAEAENEIKAADTTESTMTNDNTSLEGSLTNSRSIVDTETKVADEAPEIIETTPAAIEGQETESTVGEIHVLISQCEKEHEGPSMDSVIEKPGSDVVEHANGENNSECDSKHQVLLEPILQVQSRDIIPKADEERPCEENLEATIETKSDADNQLDIPNNKIKEEDEDVENYHLRSSEEEVITEIHLEDEVKQDEKIITEETKKNANDLVKVSKVLEETGDETVIGQEEKLQTNESVDRSLYQEVCGKSVEEFATVLDTEEFKGLDHINKDSKNKVDSSSVACLEEGDIIKGADGVDNELTKDEGWINKNSNASLLDATAEEQSKRLGVNIICDVVTEADRKTVEESQDKKESENTSIITEQQEEDNQSKHENVPATERQSEKRDIQAKDEENCILSAGESKEESNEADICSKEDIHRSIYAESEKLEFSSYTKDTSQDTDSTAVYECSEEKYPNKSTEFEKDIERLEEGSTATINTAEMHNKEDSSNFCDIPEQMEVNSQQVKQASDECKGIFKEDEENPVEANPNENIDAAVPSHEQGLEAIASGIEDQQPGRISEDVDEKKNLEDECCDSIENSTILQRDENKETQKLTEPVATTLSENDKHAIPDKDANPDNSLSNNNEEAHCEHEETIKSSDKSESKETSTHSLSDILHVSAVKRSQEPAIEKQPIHTEYLHEEKENEAEQLEDAKTDEDESSEAPVMVDAGDGDVKVTPKKSHNILSGVGSKMKHSIAKVKKAITGKSSHPKPSSPKEGDKYSKVT